jgi:hypothetical protein
MTEPIATLTVSTPRRYIAVAMLVSLGTLLLWLAMAHPPAEFGLRLFLLGLGGVMLFFTTRLWQATERHLVLTEAGLFDDTGRQLAAMDNIVSAERGFLAFKPSNGFVIRLKKAEGRAWAPGLWWRVGRRVGVGGVTGAAQSRVMAELLAMRLSGGTGFPFPFPPRDNG